MSSHSKQFGRRPGHEVPFWVHPQHHEFHIRIRQDRTDPVPLSQSDRARQLLSSAIHYNNLRKWGLSLLLVMPDHLHALLYLPPEGSLGTIISAWKSFHKRRQGVIWQENFFDHRLRSDKSKAEKWRYIRRNPVASGLCGKIEDWSWWIESDPKGGFRTGYE